MDVVNKCSLLPLLLLFVLVLLEPGYASRHLAPKGHFTERGRRPHRAASVRPIGTSSSYLKRNSVPAQEKTPHIIGPHNFTTVYGQTDTTIVLKCLVGDVINATVTWTKRTSLNSSDISVITVGGMTISRDKRFMPTNHSNVFRLHIRYAQLCDAGLYECQVPIPPATSLFIQLELTEAIAEILGSKSRYVKPGAPLRLSCIIHNSRVKPTYIFWYHWDRMINYDLGDGASVRTGRSESELIVPKADPKHAGNYSCVPSNARQATVYVNITFSHSDATFAVQQGNRSCSRVGLVLSSLCAMLIPLLAHQDWIR